MNEPLSTPTCPRLSRRDSPQALPSKTHDSSPQRSICREPFSIHMETRAGASSKSALHTGPAESPTCVLGVRSSVCRNWEDMSLFISVSPTCTVRPSLSVCSHTKMLDFSRTLSDDNTCSKRWHHFLRTSSAVNSRSLHSALSSVPSRRQLQ